MVLQIIATVVALFLAYRIGLKRNGWRNLAITYIDENFTYARTIQELKEENSNFLEGHEQLEQYLQELSNRCDQQTREIKFYKDEILRIETAQYEERNQNV